ncbi:MAG: sensor histidine kinase [Desulfuromonadaceae bacterium]|nr:sensor histidine kinase [Desulfuromonadaceae bacterium]
MDKSRDSGTKGSLLSQSGGRSGSTDETDPHDPLIARLLPLLNNEVIMTSPLYDDFCSLFHAHTRLTKRMKRIVRISDGYQSQLQELKARIKGAVEVEERSRLYRDLHDGAGQSLHAVCLHLKMLADGKGGYDDPKPLAAQLAREVADVAAELRDIAHQLRPSYLNEITLDRAISVRCEMLGRRGVPIDLVFNGDFASLPLEVSDNFYRITQEAIANASRHADAEQITVTLTRADNELRLLISDDGCGINMAQQDHDGMGLRIMRERANLIGATLEISSSPSGTAISVILEKI